MPITILIYNALIYLLSPFLILYMLYYSYVKGKHKNSFFPRFCLKELNLNKTKKTVWIHCVSVGEINAALKLIKTLSHLDINLVVSVVTETGYSNALSKLTPENLIYFPVDEYFTVKRFADKIQPSLFISMETELWPNLFYVLSKQKTPIAVINGRISDNSFKNYMKLKWFFKTVVSFVTLFIMQSEKDAWKIIKMGALKNKVTAAGNLKFDAVFDDFKDVQKATGKEKEIFTALSTHKGEEEIIIESYKKFKDEIDLIIVPRHPERAEEVMKLTEESGLNCAVYPDSSPITIVDKIGLVKEILSKTDICFVGGSMIPSGGHNILEPAVLKIPVIYGKYMHNFKEIEKIATSSGGFKVENPYELENVLNALINDKKKREKSAEILYNELLKHKGATKKVVEYLEKLL